MKKFLKIMLVIVLLIAVVATCAIRDYKKTESETSGLVVQTLAAISNPWSADAIRQRAAEGFTKAVSQQGTTLEDIVAVYGKLGKPVTPATCELHNTGTFSNTAEGTYLSASYECKEHFTNGEADIRITLQKKGQETGWKIMNLYVESPLFVQLLKR